MRRGFFAQIFPQPVRLPGAIPKNRGTIKLRSRLTPPLAAPLVNGIYQVQVDVPAAAPAPTNAAPGGGSASASGDTPSTKDDPHHAYRIPVSHYDAAYMSYLIAAFSRKGGPPIIVPSDPNSPSQNGGGNNGNGNGGGFGNNNRNGNSGGGFGGF